MKLINRPEHMGDIRKMAVDSHKTDQPDVPDQVQLPSLDEPIRASENNPFRPGDIVIYKFNTKGTVVSVEGDGVQVDFGLGVHYLSYLVLKLYRN
jgi:hypothetical protein